MRSVTYMAASIATDAAARPPARRFSFPCTLAVCLAALLATPGPLQHVYAETIAVTTTDDELNNDGDCSLREAIEAANTDTAVDACAAGDGDDVIVVPAGLYRLTLEGAEEDENQRGDLDLRSNITLSGAGEGSTRLVGQNDRVLHVQAGVEVEISDVTIEGSATRDEDGIYIRDGGIYSEGEMLRIISSTIRESIGVHTRSGIVEIIDSSIHNNGEYGGLNGTGESLKIANSTIRENHGSGIDIGFDTAEITHSTFRDNLPTDWPDDSGAGGHGIAIRSGEVRISNSIFESNAAINSDGGGILVSSGVVEVTGSIIHDNWAESFGGGISNSGTLTLIDTSIRENSAGGFMLSGCCGGGIDNSGTLTLIRSTVADNSATFRGSGIDNWGGALEIINSTISGNVTDESGGGDDPGGAISNGGGGTFTIRSSTITDNTFKPEFSSGIAAGGILNFSGSGTLENTVVAGNTVQGKLVEGEWVEDEVTPSDCVDLGDGITSLGHNLFGEDTGCPTTASDLTVDPGVVFTEVLFPLSDNGGPTLTHALRPGSPAIDSGRCTEEVDQRGEPRPSGSACDIGAFEFQAPLAEDTTAPACELERLDRSTGTLYVLTQDTGSGLERIDVLERVNTNVTLPTFSPGTTEAQTVVAAKVDPAQKSTLVLEVSDVAGNARRCDPVVTTLSAEVPERFELEQNYPNPFNPTTTIRFDVAEQTQVTLAVYDLLGRKVATLIDQQMQPGAYTAAWNGTNDAGAALPSGLYVYRIKAGSFTETKTMTLLK